MNKSIAFVLLALLLVAGVQATPGAIWTTTDSCGEPQNENHYNIGDHVFINGDNFNEDTLYSWDITGQPGGASCDPAIVVASGTHMTNGDGEFCFDAYIVANDDCGEYKATFNGKHDNYRVNAPEIPEFSVLAASVGLVGAVAGFLIIRKNN